MIAPTRIQAYISATHAHLLGPQEPEVSGVRGGLWCRGSVQLMNANA